MIVSPQPERTPDPDDLRDAANVVHGRPPMIVKKMLIHRDDPDKEVNDLFKMVDTRIVEVDAKIIERSYRDRTGRRINEIKHYPTLRQLLRSPTMIRNVRESAAFDRMKEIATRNVQLREVGGLNQGFALGLYDDEMSSAPGNGNVFRIGDTFLPSTVGPNAKQMLFADYQDAHRKSFEAATKNPLGKRIVKVIPQFVLGRGVTGTHSDDRYQKAWLKFWAANDVRARLKVFLRELLMYGEIFLRYFKTRDGLVVRSLDPSTIWDVVTEPDDLEAVLYYHQQYVILNRSIVPGIGTNNPSTLVIRQIPAADLDHYKINATSSEKRGRSELLAVLGYLVRFKDYVNDRILLNKIRSMFALDITVEGEAGDVAAAEQQFSQPPGSGAVIIHNKTVAVDFKSTNTGAGEAHTDAELLLQIIAIGAGISPSFLGGSTGNSRAAALIQTEPDVKNFEDYQEILDHVLHQMSNRAFVAAGLALPDGDTVPTMEFVFPAIASEDRSAKLKDIGFSESMDYISKRRAAEMSAREFGISTYDFAKEQQEIGTERKKNPKMAATMQQVPKEGPTVPMPAPGQPGGVGGPPLPVAPAAGAFGKPAAGKTAVPGAKPVVPKGAKVAKAKKVPVPGAAKKGPQLPSKKGVSQTSGEMGLPAKQGKGGRGLAKTKATLGRGKFTRSGEKKSQQTNRTSDTARTKETQLREHRGPGWTDKARIASLVSRRARRAQQQLEVSMAEAEAQADAELEQQVSALVDQIDQLKSEP